MKKLIAIAAIALLVGFAPRIRATPLQYDKQIVTVHTGDTLWSIASRYSGDVYMLAYLDKLKALPENTEVLSQKYLQAGDRVTVLVAQKKEPLRPASQRFK